MPDDIRKLTQEVLRDPITVQGGAYSACAYGVACALSYETSTCETALLMKLLHQTDIRVGPDIHAHEAQGEARRGAVGKGRIPCSVIAGEPVAEQTSGCA